MVGAADSLDAATEAAWVRRARRGDLLATRQLVDAHKDRLFAFIRRMIRHHHDAEEICQEAFLKAFASLDSYRSEFRFSTWLFTIGYRVCLNWMRRKRALTGDLDLGAMGPPVADAESISLESEAVGRLKDLIWSAVDTLSPPQRAAVLLFYRHQESCHAIAGILDLPVATVKSHLHRARAKLRTLLEPIAEREGLGRICNLAG
jgi:RNA polymerase sigma-70 factor (ECF subfamily)